MRARLVLGTILASGLVAPSAGAQAIFRDLGPGSANAVSADGSVVVGSDFSQSPTEAFRWTEADGIDRLGGLGSESFGLGVSPDGVAVVGDSANTAGQDEAFRWTESDGMIGLGTLPGGTFPSLAYGVSADGSVVVGEAHQGPNAGFEGFRWTPSEGMVGLGFLPGDNASRAAGVSGDGSIMIGSSQLLDGSLSIVRSEAVVWTDGVGVVGLGDLGHETSARSFGRAVSLDGGTVVGAAQRGQGGLLKPFRWSAAAGMTELPLLMGSSGSAFAVSADGVVVLGQEGSDYLLWDRRGNVSRLVSTVFPQPASSLFSRWGFDLSDWQNFLPTNLSADGRTVVGWGNHVRPDGGCCIAHAWMAVIRACDDGIDDDDDGLVDFPNDPGCTDAADVSEENAPPACGDGVDDDGDGRVDFPADPGCASLSDVTETDPTLICDDATDNDGDGFADAADPGCPFPESSPENPLCDDGIDNDGDGNTDFADAACSPTWPYWEARPCGVGAELLAALGLLTGLRRRR
jgi:probable HAF family extracellular repeat protein